MFNIFNLFSKPKLPFVLGALKSPEDKRTVNAVAFQTPVALPEDEYNNLPPVENQGGKSICVGEAIHKVKEAFDLADGNYIDLSGDDLYEQCKEIDGIPGQLGTYPLVGAKVATGTGIASVDVYNGGSKEAIVADRARHKLAQFASVSSDFESVAQAIHANKYVTASFAVDNNWFAGIITRVLQAVGRHYVVLQGFVYSAQIVRGQNSWGTSWMGKVASYLDPRLSPGHFDVYWPDVSDSVVDLFCFTNKMPQPIIDHVTNLNYYFAKRLQYGNKGYDVVQLQKRMNKEVNAGLPTDGNYGPRTSQAVLTYQLKNLVGDPATLMALQGHYVGPATLRALNGTNKIDILTAVIMQESGGNDYAVGDKTLVNKAYGALQIRQGVADAVNHALGTSYKAQDCLGNRDLSINMWTTYFTKCYPNMVSDQDKAFTWNGGPGWKQFYGKKGYETYTKNLDAYWSNISGMLMK